MVACINATRAPMQLAMRASIVPDCVAALVGARFFSNNAPGPRQVQARTAPALSLAALGNLTKENFRQSLTAAQVLYGSKEDKASLAVSDSSIQSCQSCNTAAQARALETSILMLPHVN
jgi:hypothetical protein